MANIMRIIMASPAKVNEKLNRCHGYQNYYCGWHAEPHVVDRDTMREVYFKSPVTVGTQGP